MGRDKKIQQDNSSLIKGNNPAPYMEFNLEKFKENLLGMVLPSVEEFREHWRILAQDYRDDVMNKVKELQSSMKKLIAADSLSIDLVLNEPLNEACEILRKSSLKNYSKIKTQKKGRPPVNGRIAIVLLAALQATKGNRELKDQIGKYIQFNGEFHELVKKKFGAGIFEKLNLPSVRIDDERWDASIKRPLELAGLKFLMDTPSAKSNERSYQINLMKLFESMKSRAHVIPLTDDELDGLERLNNEDLAID